jgi:hypothetical protein
VVEFQARGVIHVHAIIRLDGPPDQIHHPTSTSPSDNSTTPSPPRPRMSTTTHQHTTARYYGCAGGAKSTPAPSQLETTATAATDQRIPNKSPPTSPNT